MEQNNNHCIECTKLLMLDQLVANMSPKKFIIEGCGLYFYGKMVRFCSPYLMHIFVSHLNFQNLTALVSRVAT